MIDLWYKNAVVYCLDVETFVDSDGDGIGDFAGLSHRLDHISGLGANCIWLMPFHPSPNRDDGYDVLDYYDVDRRLGSPGDFVNFTREARERGIRVIIDLVVNHTSIEHPWFKAARSSRDSRYRSYYIWADEPPQAAAEGVVFPGYQESTWTYDETAGQYYYHRFYDHQPDLNIANPAVQEEIEKIMGFWIELGVSGFRIDAAPFLIELKGEAAARWDDRYQYLNRMRNFLQWRRGDAILLAEANVPHEEILDYIGDGYRMHMVFAFLINQYTFLSLAREQSGPLRSAFELLPRIPELGQWATFLRNHDELDLGRLSTEEREEVFERFAPDPDMRLYERGIRRRLATMLDGDERRIALAHALLLSLPGTPVLYYGDEIGMGDDQRLSERHAVRTAMQWSDEPNAGFSTAPSDRIIRPVVRGGPFGYERRNVADQSRDPDSLMNTISQMIRTRRASPEFGWGTYRMLDVDAPEVFAHRCDWQGNTVVVLHNLCGEPRDVIVDLETHPTPRCWITILEDGEYGDAPSAGTAGSEIGTGADVAGSESGTGDHASGGHPADHAGGPATRGARVASEAGAETGSGGDDAAHRRSHDRRISLAPYGYRWFRLEGTRR